MRLIVCSIALLALLIQGSAADRSGLLESIRNDDLEAVKKQLEAGADVNSKDSTGATALMHAALYSSPACVKLLLDRGADAKQGNIFGTTALMWGAGSPEKVRLLIAHGADVNAKARSGRTPLIVAASINGNLESVKLLLKAGADVKARDSSGVGPVLAASQITDAAILTELLAKGADPNESSTRLGQTPLMNAAGFGSLSSVKALLDGGADVNRRSLEPGEIKAGLQDRGLMTALLWAAPFADREIVQLLLSRKADPNIPDYRGMNALTLAATSEAADPEVLRLLLAGTKDVNRRDKGGLTALDWAIKFGDTKVARLLRETGLEASTASNSEAAAAPHTALGVRQAVEKSVALMQNSNKQFFQASGCLGCHHTMLGGMLVGVAKSKGLAVDPVAAAEQLKTVATLRMVDREGILQQQRPGGYPMSFSLLLISMHAQGYPADALTDAVVHSLLAGQQCDGSWRGFDQRPPSEYSAFSETAYAIRAIQLYAPPGRRAEIPERARRAASWLSSAKATQTEEKVMRLLGLAWSDAPESTVRPLAARLLAEQKDEGGWAQREGFPSDAYATGQTLFALNQAAHIPASQQAYQRGVRYLLKNQHEDGSWYVKSRSVKFQPYFESGFPHGHDQWISAAGTCWAAMSLALSLER